MPEVIAIEDADVDDDLTIVADRVFLESGVYFNQTFVARQLGVFPTRPQAGRLPRLPDHDGDGTPPRPPLAKRQRQKERRRTGPPQPQTSGGPSAAAE